MLGTLAFIAVGQQHREAAQAHPLLLRARNELVDHDLGAVAEVPKLRFPNRQRIGRAQGKAVLEAENGIFAQERIVNAQFLLGAEIVEGHIFLLGRVDFQHGVAVGKCAALHILA